MVSWKLHVLVTERFANR